MLKIAVINGPNLNLLGTREPEIYGRQTMAEINARIESVAQRLGFTVRFEQHNGEGEIVSAIHQAAEWADGLIINPGAYSHYSYAIRDAITAVRITAIEVHLSNIFAREDFRQTSVTAPACTGVISGCGATGYILALHFFADKEDVHV